ncbi:MAG: hypothetical protein AAGH45_08475, partial [Pseudomonadota bacterium]
FVDDIMVFEQTLDQPGGAGFPTPENTFVYDFGRSIVLDPGDEIRVEATNGGGDYVRMDEITLDFLTDLIPL